MENEILFQYDEETMAPEDASTFFELFNYLNDISRKKKVAIKLIQSKWE